MQQNTEVLRQVLEELKQLNTNRSVDASQGNRLKDVGAAYAVVAVFIASIDVGLLIYAHDYFSDRPEGTPAQVSDSAINTLWFLSIIFAGIAAMQFAVMQVFSGEISPESPDPNSINVDVNDVEKGRADSYNNTESGGNDMASHTRNPIHRARQRFTMLHSSGVTAIVLLMLSMTTLFTGILVFVWSDQTKSVAIIVTVLFGLAWLVPKIPSSICLSTASLLGL